MDSDHPPFALTQEEYETVGALAEVIIPSGEDPSAEPGAKQVGVKNFFDSIFFEMSESQKTRTRAALTLVETRSGETFGGRRFRELSVADRDRVIKSMLSKGDSRLSGTSLTEVPLAQTERPETERGYSCRFRNHSFLKKLPSQDMPFPTKIISP